MIWPRIEPLRSLSGIAFTSVHQRFEEYEMKKLLASALGLAVAVSACDTPEPTATDAESAPPLAAALEGSQNIVDFANAGLEAQGAHFRIAYAEYYTDPSSGHMGTVIFANNRGNKQLSSDFVPGDDRRAWPVSDGDYNTIDYVIDAEESADLPPGTSVAAIDRAMGTWEAVTCSAPGLSGIFLPQDLGYVQYLVGTGGGIPAVAADLTHGGFLGAPFFDALIPGGSGFILGVTFTFIWVDSSTGVPTDVDHNGKDDVAFREIYYNDAFSWADDGTSHIDVETVALHEAGHGLSQAHFGKIFGTVANGKFHFSPRAVMNASYSGVQREIGKTDNAGHCSNWASWPIN
jgi:hypothetical protein